MVPQLDHVTPGVPHTILIHVLDRRDNRRARGDEVLGRRPPQTGRTDRPRKSPRRVAARKGSEARQLDQFYTRDEIAVRYLSRLAERYHLPACLLVEPSAGGGAFYRRMPINTVAFDLDPRCPGILKADFLAISLISDRRIVTVGNPPFGRNACLAVDFFNHAAVQSDVIAMIFPRSFLKVAIENRLHRAFHRVHCEEVPPYAFELDGERRDVAVMFQIWERRPFDRVLRDEEAEHPDFTFSTSDLCDFVVRRVGANAGKISHDRNVHKDSHYFIKGDVEHVMRQLDLAGAARNATSTPSLAKSEIVALYKRHVRRLRRR